MITYPYCVIGDLRRKPHVMQELVPSYIPIIIFQVSVYQKLVLANIYILSERGTSGFEKDTILIFADFLILTNQS